MTDDRGVHDVLIVGAGFAGMYLLHRLRAGGRGAGNDPGATPFKLTACR